MSSIFKHRLLAILVLLLALAGGWVFVNRVEIKQDAEEWWSKRELPPPIAAPSAVKQFNNSAISPEDIKDIKEIKEITEISAQGGSPPKADGPRAHAFGGKEIMGIDNGIASPPRADRNDIKELPPEINLAVPFMVQAPYAVWDKLHEESCEEAALIMFNAFFKGIQKISRDEAELAIQNLVQWEKKTFGYFEDTTAEENVRILKEYFGLVGAKAIYDVSISDIKKELAASRPVVVPAAGKLLKNSYFRNGGPVYHMLIIKGYTKDGRFITNEPGTKRGADFTYEFEDLFQAIHDWNAGEVLKGRKVMLVVDG